MAFLALAVIMRGTFYLLLAIFTIYSLFLAYHWFAYGTNARVSTVALSIYLLGSAVAFLTMSAFVM